MQPSSWPALLSLDQNYWALEGVLPLGMNNSLLWESTLDIVGSLVASLNTSNFQLPSCDKQKCLQTLPHVWDKFTPRWESALNIYMIKQLFYLACSSVLLGIFVIAAPTSRSQSVTVCRDAFRNSEVKAIFIIMLICYFPFSLSWHLC